MHIEASGMHISFSMHYKVTVMTCPLHFMHILSVHKTSHWQAATEEQLMIHEPPEHCVQSAF